MRCGCRNCVLKMPSQIHSLNESLGKIVGRDSWSGEVVHEWEKATTPITKKAGAGVSEIINVGSSKWRMFTNAGLDSSDPAIAMSLWNCDKTAFSTSASAAKFLVQGTKAVYKIGGGFGCECIIVHRAGSGYHSSFIQGKNLHKRWMEGGPIGQFIRTPPPLPYLVTQTLFSITSNASFHLFFLLWSTYKIPPFCLGCTSFLCTWSCLGMAPCTLPPIIATSNSCSSGSKWTTALPSCW